LHLTFCYCPESSKIFFKVGILARCRKATDKDLGDAESGLNETLASTTTTTTLGFARHSQLRFNLPEMGFSLTSTTHIAKSRHTTRGQSWF
jgi:hypothetical protein